MANRAVPVIIQLLIFYIFISWFVRLLRRRSRTTPRTPGQGTQPAPSSSHKTEHGRTVTTPVSQSRRSAGVSPREASPALVRREEVMFNGVRWQVTYRPRHDPDSGTKSLRREVYVEEPPRCPKCGLGVIETKSWLGYTWSCPECGLRQHSGRNMQDVARALARGLH